MLAPASVKVLITTGSPTEPLLVSDNSGVRTLTFNRPAAFNSFDLALKDARVNEFVGDRRKPDARVLGEIIGRLRYATQNLAAETREVSGRPAALQDLGRTRATRLAMRLRPLDDQS